MFQQSRRTLLAAGFLLCGAFVLKAENSLAPDTMDRAISYLEWVLDVQFSSEQQQHCRALFGDLVRDKKPGAADTLLTMARAEQEISRVSPGQRDSLRVTKQREFVQVLQNGTSESSRWLLGVYQDAHAGDTGLQPLPISTVLLGKWRDGYVSSVQYKNAYTGVMGPTNGRTFSYEFRPDGTYSFTGLMQLVSYNCTTATFSNETGRYTVSGNAVSLRPESNPHQMTNNCAPSSNHTSPGKLIDRTYRFRVVVENGRRSVELQGDNGGPMRFAESR